MHSASSGPIQISLLSSTSSTPAGTPVSFNGTVVGLNVTSVTYVVVAPDGSTSSGVINTAGSSFQFSLTFQEQGNWTVYCEAGITSSPSATSDDVIVSVEGGASPNYLGIPVFWLGVGILAISAGSLAYLVYVFRKRAQEEERQAARKPSSPHL
jgi:hypothetical protein